MDKPIKRFFLLSLLICICFIFSGCRPDKSLEGNWETVSLIIDGQAQNVHKSNINFEYRKNDYYANGFAGANLYYASVKTKGKKYEASGMENTGFMGKPAQMEYEAMFFEVLMNSDSYNFENDTLILFSSSKNNSMQLIKK